MYTILGGDQQQYGPVDQAEVMRWIQNGQATADTMIFKQGGSEWVKLSTLPEFAGALTGNLSGMPMSPGMAMPHEPTKIPKVFGILHIVFGVLCGICAVTGMVGNFGGAAVVQVEEISNYFTILGIISVLTGIANLILLIGGIGLLKYAKWGRTLSMVYSILAIIVGLANVTWQFFMKPESMGTMSSEAEAVGRSIGLVVGAVMILIYPIITIVFMNKQVTKDALK